MRFRRAKQRGIGKLPRLPLVALIDVVLFLLMYFLIASHFNAPESRLETTLKTDSKGGGSAGVDLRPTVLRVVNEGGKVKFRMGDRVMNDRESLTAVLTELPKQGGVVVKVANDVPVSGAAAALQAAKDAGFTKISYVPTT